MGSQYLRTCDVQSRLRPDAAPRIVIPNSPQIKLDLPYPSGHITVTLDVSAESRPELQKLVAQAEEGIRNALKPLLSLATESDRAKAGKPTPLMRELKRRQTRPKNSGEDTHSEADTEGGQTDFPAPEASAA